MNAGQRGQQDEGVTYEHFIYAPNKEAADAVAAALQGRGVLVPYEPHPSYSPLLAHLRTVHGYEPGGDWPDISAAREIYGCSNSGCAIPGAWLVMGYTGPSGEWAVRDVALASGCSYDGGGQSA